MKEALKLAIKAKGRFEVPVGSIIVKNHKIIGTGFNENISKHTVSAHAEIIAINSAGAFLENYRLNGCDIYVTLEPCHMCAKAIVDARIKTLYFATPDPKTGAIISVDNFLDKAYLNHKVSYEHGFLQEESSKMLRDFFLQRRKNNIC